MLIDMCIGVYELVYTCMCPCSDSWEGLEATSTPSIQYLISNTAFQ